MNVYTENKEKNNDQKSGRNRCYFSAFFSLSINRMSLLKYLLFIPFFYKQSIFDSRTENCLGLSEKFPKKMFSNCLLDGLLISIVFIFKLSERWHSLLETPRVCNAYF